MRVRLRIGRMSLSPYAALVLALARNGRSKYEIYKELSKAAGGRDLKSVVYKLISDLTEQGLLEERNGIVRTTEKGETILRTAKESGEIRRAAEAYQSMAQALLSLA